MGTPDIGLASAGQAARAQDASTVFTNPAGMTRLPSMNIMLGAQLINAKVDFDPDANAGPQTGGDGGNAVGNVPGGSFFLTQEMADNLSVGIGAFSYFGGMVDYDDDWVGRYFCQSASLAGMTLMPAIAYRINDMISIGMGLNAMYGMMEMETAIHNLAAQDDGRLTLEDKTWGYGANIGVLFTLDQATRIGVTYLSQVNLDFSDTPEFENLGPGLSSILSARNLITSSIDLGIKVPQRIMVSIYQQVGDRFAVMGNAGWQNWSRFGVVDISVDSDNPVSLTTESTYDDTWHIALGGQYAYSSQWQYSAGIAYDSSMLKDEYRTPALPVGEAWRFGLGTQYTTNKRIKIGLDYEFIYSGSLDMDRSSPLGGRLSGKYEDMSSHVVGINAALSF